jgi:Fe-S-cluster containining protein
MGFTCKGCGLCCSGDRGIQVNLTIGDVYRICEYLMITVEEFFERYAGMKAFGDPRHPKVYDVDIGLDMPCKFRKDGKCSIYPARPLNCRIFPYWLLVRAKEDKLKELLKGKCEYTLDKKSLKQCLDYQNSIGAIILSESKFYETNKKSKTKNIKDSPELSLIKASIIENLDNIKYNRTKIFEAEGNLKGFKLF